MKPEHLRIRLSNAAVAFRGYDLKNLGRSDELLAHSTYGPVVQEALEDASRAYTRITGRPMDLVARVEAGQEMTLEQYSEAVLLVMTMEIAQLRLLQQFFDIHYRSAQLAFGFSVGELVALVAGGVFSLEEILSVCLPLADDVIAQARVVTLAVLFSRGDALPTREVHRLCLRVNQEGCGVVGVSAYLSPNSLVLMGQSDTLDRFAALMPDYLPHGVHLRKKDGRWGPLHTPIIRQAGLRDRFAARLLTLQGGDTAPSPPIVSLATGENGYDDGDARELLDTWIDHPQRLWDAVCKTLSLGIETVVHVGPQPNIIPATFGRLRDNVEAQMRMNMGMRVLSGLASRGWLKTLLPARAALLRSLYVQHVILEDWLLAQRVQRTTVAVVGRPSFREIITSTK